MYYAQECSEFARPIFESFYLGNAAPFKEVLQWWRAVGNTVSGLAGPRFEPQTSRSRNDYVTAQTTGRYFINNIHETVV